MKRFQPSQEINPWTARNRKKSSDTVLSKDNQNSRDFISRSLPLRERSQPIERLNPPPLNMQKIVQLPLLRQTIGIRPGRAISDKRVQELDQLLNDDFYSKFLPNYKLINIQFASNGQPRTKPNKLPYHIQSLRQYTDHHQIVGKNIVNHSRERANPKPRRCFTEQKDKNDEIYLFQNELSKSIDLEGKTHSKLAIKGKEAVRIIHQRKKEDLIELMSKHGKMKSIGTQLSYANGVMSNKLSLMKRNYNMKKIRKILT